MKKLISILSAACMMAFGGVAEAQTAPMIDQVKERGVLRAGVKTDLPYIGFIDEKGKNAGFEIDLLHDLAKRLGVKIEFVPTNISTRVQMLQQNRIDLIMAGMTHYRNRDDVVDFSIDYLYTPQTLLVKKNSGINSVADMAGKRMGAATGAGSVKKFPLAQPKATVQTFNSWSEAFFALERGLVDAIATENTVLQSLKMSASNPDDYVLLGKDGIYSGGYFAVAVRPDDSKSRDTINYLLQDQFLDGTWQRAFDKWLGKDSEMKLSISDFDNYAMRVWD